MIKFRRNNVYMKWGLTAFVTVLAILAMYDILFGAHKIAVYFGVLSTIFTPIIYGGAIAYLLAPIVDFLERTVLRPWAAPGTARRKPRGWVRVVSVLLTLAIVLGAVALLLYFLISDVAANIAQLANNINSYISVVQGWLEGSNGVAALPPEVIAKLEGLYEQAMEMLNSATAHSMSSMIAAVSGGVLGVVDFLGNLVVGIVIAAYMMGMKETLAAQAKKIICAIFTSYYVERIMDAVRYADKVFGGFIRGNIVVSVLIGLICFVALSIIDVPYAPLLAVLLGVTNLIPFFGPFLGAIPSAILIFLIDPIKSLEFIIFILVLQQLDGNILTPKILGESTGLASLWVIISVLVAGGLFGPIGMLLGCPVFALLYALIRLGVNKGLEKRKLPVPTDVYRSQGTPRAAESEEQV